MLKHLLIFGAVAATLGMLTVGLGLVPVAASAGHWPPAKWFLHFTMRRSVTMQARDIQAPKLSDPILARQGAGFYAFNCASCHGAPGQRAALAGSLMIPPAPALDRITDTWKPRELFWIVKHGIKYTAMPGWASQARDDEVWAVVAFLYRMPSLSPSDYRQLAFGTPESADPSFVASALRVEGARSGLAVCAGCHGFDGKGRDGTAPALAGQRAEYLAVSLRDYAAARRASGIMQPLSAALSDEDIATLSTIFAVMPSGREQARSYNREVDVGASLLATRGAEVAQSGVPERDVAACAPCHGQQARAAQPLFPKLEGQYAEYLAQQLRLFRNGVRTSTPSAALMRSAIGEISDAQIEAVAQYYYGTRPAP